VKKKNCYFLLVGFSDAWYIKPFLKRSGENDCFSLGWYNSSCLYLPN